MRSWCWGIVHGRSSCQDPGQNVRNDLGSHMQELCRKLGKVEREIGVADKRLRTYASRSSRLRKLEKS